MPLWIIKLLLYSRFVLFASLGEDKKFVKVMNKCKMKTPVKEVGPGGGIFSLVKHYTWNVKLTVFLNSNRALLSSHSKCSKPIFSPPNTSKHLEALQLNSLSVLVLSLKCILEGTWALSCFRNDEMRHKLC